MLDHVIVLNIWQINSLINTSWPLEYRSRVMFYNARGERGSSRKPIKSEHYTLGWRSSHSFLSFREFFSPFLKTSTKKRRFRMLFAHELTRCQDNAHQKRKESRRNSTAFLVPNTSCYYYTLTDPIAEAHHRSSSFFPLHWVLIMSMLIQYL